MENKTILVVDDEADLRFLLSSVLEQAGYSVISAADGYEAIHLLSKNGSFGLIFLDLMMPKMNGWEFLKIKGQDSAFADIPVVAVTAFADRVKDLKVDAVIKKPFDLNSLIGAAERFCK